MSIEGLRWGHLGPLWSRDGASLPWVMLPRFTLLRRRRSRTRTWRLRRSSLLGRSRARLTGIRIVGIQSQKENGSHNEPAHGPGPGSWPCSAVSRRIMHMAPGPAMRAESAPRPGIDSGGGGLTVEMLSTPPHTRTSMGFMGFVGLRFGWHNDGGHGLWLGFREWLQWVWIWARGGGGRGGWVARDLQTGLMVPDQ